jgi:hypothetical protein
VSYNPWTDMTAIGDSHEIQFNMETGEYRHRPINMNRYGKTRHSDLVDEAYELTDWKPGHPGKTPKPLDQSDNPHPFDCD